MSRIAVTKDGTDSPTTATRRMRISATPPRRRAAQVPSGNATANATAIAAAASASVQRRWARINGRSGSL
jgi:hypothetical protein